MDTYIITRSEIEEVLDMKDYVSIIENAFGMLKEVQMPPKVYLTFPEGDLRCMPAYIPAMEIAGVKNVNVHPRNKDMPTVMAFITLFDPETGFPLAIMSGTHITNMRTGAAGGVAARYLAREDSRVAAFIGAGVQASTQLDALVVVRNIERVNVYDINEANVRSFTERAEGYGLEVEAPGSVEDVAAGADIIVTTTPVKSPIVMDVPKGAHVNAIGADAQGKQELSPGVLKKARIVVDNWEQASHSGEINVPLAQGIITRDDVYADIGEIVTGEKPARDSREMITVFDSTGLAVQDICAAGEIFKRVDKKGLKRIRLV